MVSEISDPVKPVVWLTYLLDMLGHNLECPKNLYYKKRVRINIPMKDAYKRWFRDFTRGTRYSTWYVSEKTIMIDDVLLVEDLVTGEILLDNRNHQNLSA